MNDPQFVEASRILAQQAVQTDGSPERKLDFLALRTLARPLEASEQTTLLNARSTFLAHFAAAPADAEALLKVGETAADPALDPIELATWTMVANQFFNLDEFLNK